jgi:hypothetical protein
LLTITPQQKDEFLLIVLRLNQQKTPLPFVREHWRSGVFGRNRKERKSLSFADLAAT